MIPMSEGQALALDQLREMVSGSNGAIDMPLEPTATSADGWLRIQVSLDCAGTPRAPGGLRLRKRERFILLIPSSFPFDIPVVQVPHHRWADTPHVQWGIQLCMYAAPSIEWVPADGLFGLVDRLSVWLEHAALGELDPHDQPLHPPVAYATSSNGVMVVRADLGDLAPPAAESGRRKTRPGSTVVTKPESDPTYRFVVGISEVHDDHRFDVVEWVTRQEWLRRFLAGELPPVRGRPVVGSLAVLTDREMSFEYPGPAAALVTALEGLGVHRDDLFAAIGEVGAVNYELARGTAADALASAAELHMFVGTPSRRLADGVLRQHLVCWKFDEIGRLVAENLIYADADNPLLAQLGGLAQKLLPKWIAHTETTWVQVMEARTEVTLRRDTASSAEWVRGRRVMVLGCGALGAPIAEFCVRAGATEVRAIDNGVVTPGVLVRQPYTDADIGSPKALALATKLNQITLGTPVCAAVGSAQTVVLAAGAGPPAVDLVIDATADAIVGSLLELRRSTAREAWPPVMSVIIGRDARRGVVTIAKRGAAGAGRHILRRLSLVGRGQHAARLEDVADDFFPTEPDRKTFQPEPGCSSPTFTGSAADLSALAGHLFDSGLRTLSDDCPGPASERMVAGVVRLDGSTEGKARPSLIWFGWPDDELYRDRDTGYEIRISQPALSHMLAEVRRGARLRGPDVETGGLLLGQVDDACRCIWVDDVSGPPVDSLLSAVHFDHGIEGVPEVIAYQRERSGKLTGFLGMWHSHPFGPAAPSPTDEAAMRELVTPVAANARRALIVIVGGDDTLWESWVHGDGVPAIFARFVTRSTAAGPQPAPPVPPRHQADGWPGGWASRSSPNTPRRITWPRSLIRRLRRRRETP